MRPLSAYAHIRSLDLLQFELVFSLKSSSRDSHLTLGSESVKLFMFWSWTTSDSSIFHNCSKFHIRSPKVSSCLELSFLFVCISNAMFQSYVSDLQHVSSLRSSSYTTLSCRHKKLSFLTRYGNLVPVVDQHYIFSVQVLQLFEFISFLLSFWVLSSVGKMNCCTFHCSPL